MSLHKFQFGFVFQGLHHSTRNFAWLHFNQGNTKISKFNLVLPRHRMQRDHLRFAGSRSPEQELQFGIPCRNALGVNRTPRVFKNLYKQDPCATWLYSNLLAQTQNKGFVQGGAGCEACLGLGGKTQKQYSTNQGLDFHNSRLNGCSSSDMRNIKQFIHFRDDLEIKGNMKIIILSGLLALSFSSLTMATSYPLILKDDLGRTVKLAAAPKRIVSMMPSHTETLFAVGASSSVVGIDEYSNYPKLETEKLPKTGNGFAPNLEAIAALKPDLVLTDESSGSKLVQNLEKLGITVYAGVPQTYNDVFEKISLIGKITNLEKNALKLITKMRNELGTIQASVATLPRVSVYYEVDPTPYAAGSSSFIGALIFKAGGNNIISEKLGAFPQISPELVISSNPSVILGAKLEDVLKRPGWDKIAAVKTGRVITFSSQEDDAISRPGPRLPVALRVLAKALHPELKI